MRQLVVFTVRAASLAALAALAAAPLAAQDWQSLAHSPGTGNQGYSFGHERKDLAEAAALEACRSGQPGSEPRDCVLLASSRQCLALVKHGGAVEAVSARPAELRVKAERLCASRGGSDCAVTRNICEDQRRAAEAIDQAPAQ